MEFIIAKSGGFCRGVQKAVDTALSITPENTYIYGEIIHNKDVVHQITERGIKTIDDLDEVPNGATLIIRSHGVGKAVFEKCAEKNLKVVDCTCEFVRRTQQIIQEQYQKGKTIVIVYVHNTCYVCCIVEVCLEVFCKSCAFCLCNAVR